MRVSPCNRGGARRRQLSSTRTRIPRQGSRRAQYQAWQPRTRRPVPPATADGGSSWISRWTQNRPQPQLLSGCDSQANDTRAIGPARLGYGLLPSTSKDIEPRISCLQLTDNAPVATVGSALANEKEQ